MDASVPDALPADMGVPPVIDPLVELSRVCGNSGGVFARGECICPNEQEDGGVAVLENFDARQGGSCARPLKAVSACASGGLEKLLNSQGLAAFRTCVEAPLYGFKRSTVALRLPAQWATVADALPLARWLDQRLLPPLSFFAKLTPPPGGSDSLQVLIGADSIDLSRVYESFYLPPIDPGDPDLGSIFPRVLHVPSLDALDWALGNTLAGMPPARASTPSAQAGALGATTERAIAETHFDTGGVTNIGTIIERCLGICDVRQDYTLTSDRGDAIHAWRVRRYQSGVLYRETLAVGDPVKKRVDAWVVFDLGGEPSLIFQVDYGVSRLQPTLRAYDRNWQPLGVFPFDLLPDATQALSVAQSASPLGDHEAGVILWDTGIAFDNNALNAALLVGPHRADPIAAHGSLLGWLDAPADDVVSFLDGARMTKQGIYLPEVYPNFHGASVARILLGQDQAPLRILAASTPDDVAEPSVLSAVASDAKLAAQVRVVNLSSFWPMDAEACRVRFPRGLSAHFLWVAGAGNSGRNSTPQSPLARCPQELDLRDNLLVVAGAVGTTSWIGSDTGSTYADLAADCTGDTGNCGGTSYSAPRVARTAALIVNQYRDKISNPMVRMAILLGVTLPVTPEPYRSGGYHNHNDALTAAAKLVDGGLGGRNTLTADEAHQLLHQLYSDSAYADQKYTVLQQNGTFSP
jgi:hypothetical protein